MHCRTDCRCRWFRSTRGSVSSVYNRPLGGTWVGSPRAHGRYGIITRDSLRPAGGLGQVIRFRRRVALRASSRQVPGRSRRAPNDALEACSRIVQPPAGQLRQKPVGLSVPVVALPASLRCCAGAQGLSSPRRSARHRWLIIGTFPVRGAYSGTTQANLPAGCRYQTKSVSKVHTSRGTYHTERTANLRSNKR